MDQSRNFGRAGSMYDHGRAVSTVRTPVVSDFRRGGGFLERSLSPEVMLTRSSLCREGGALVGTHARASCREHVTRWRLWRLEQASSPGGNYGWN
jgi:hypothetical protein